MEEFDKIEIQHICSNICSGGTPKSTIMEYYGGNIPWLNTKEINFSRIYDTEKKITEEGFNNSSAKWIPENSVIVAMYGATAGKTAIAKIPLTTNQACCNLTINSNKADYRFVYYALCNDYAYLASLANGGAQQNLNAQQIKEFEIHYPPLDKQKRIADILSSLDDKIELNRRINDNLEQQAQALFKSWFVDFEPFRDDEFIDSELGKIPKGWEIGTIEDLCQNIASGSTPSSMNQEYYNGEIKWFTTKELKDSFLIDSEKHISDEGHKNSSTKMFPRGTVLMAIYAAPTVGRLGILTSDATFNQAAVGLNPKQEIGSNYVFLLLKKERDNFNNLAIGAAQQNLSVKFVKTYPIIIPSKKVIVDFNVLVNPFFDRISLLSKEFEALTGTRDTLLPKLMSGKLRISEIEKEK